MIHKISCMIILYYNVLISSCNQLMNRSRQHLDLFHKNILPLESDGTVVLWTISYGFLSCPNICYIYNMLLYIIICYYYIIIQVSKCVDAKILSLITLTTTILSILSTYLMLITSNLNESFELS